MSTVASFCRNCGKALTDEEKAVETNVLCTACAAEKAALEANAPVGGYAPEADAPPRAWDPHDRASSSYAGSSPYTAPAGPASGAPSPGIAFLLGLIPGVGAIYNGQYAKGLIHVFVFGVLVSISEHRSSHGDFGPLFAFLLPAFVFYMAFEAYHTAGRRVRGETVDEFSSLVPIRSHSLAAPAAMIIVGVLFLLNNLELLRISQLIKFWPVGLIALGVYMLYTRIQPSAGSNASIEQEYRQ